MEIAEEVWGHHQRMVMLDPKGEEGCELSMITALKFVELAGHSLTHTALKDILKEIDVDSNGNISLLEYFVFKFEIDWKEMVNTPRDNVDEVMAEAEAGLNKAKGLMDVAIAAAAAAAADLAAAQTAEENAKEEEAKGAQAEADALALEESSQAAQAGAEATLSGLNTGDEGRNKIIAELTATSENEELSTVKRSKAKNELSQMLAKDDHSSSRGKILQESAVKKAEN
jgi:hypothetical protein